MPKTLTIALAQLNPVLGDVAGNEVKARSARAEAARLGADLVMFPELYLSGYPPEDLVLKPAFQDACRRACEALARETGDGGPAVLIVQKSDGGFTYAATDFAAIRYRFCELDADEALYVVGQPQTMHFAMVFRTARDAGWLTGEHRAVHVAFGSVLGEDGKMLRTRSGDPIKLIDLLHEAVERAAALVEDADPEVARAVGIGSLKYADLVNDRERDYTFSWDRMLSLDGNTGVYLQYAVARIRSMLEKAGEGGESEPGPFTQPAERALALRLVAFPTALEKAVEQAKPHILARALYDLAQSFSAFYERCPVLRAEDEPTRALRLLLSAATERTLAAGLDLLGIEAPQRL